MMISVFKKPHVRLCFFITMVKIKELFDDMISAIISKLIISKTPKIVWITPKFLLSQF